jgi:hypothetical protein
MNDHPTKVAFGMLQIEPKALAEALAGLRYDALAEYITALGDRLAEDAEADTLRKRQFLAAQLRTTSVSMSAATMSVLNAWLLCAEHEKRKAAK